jgi:hypothetical protein
MIMLHSISDDGHITWKCHSTKKGCKTHVAHISDEGVRWASPTEVLLPACETCTEQRMLKVVYSDEEMEPDSMKTYGMVPVEKTVFHAITREPIPVYIPELLPIGWNPGPERHKELAKQLIASGKVPPK